MNLLYVFGLLILSFLLGLLCQRKTARMIGSWLATIRRRLYFKKDIKMNWFNVFVAVVCILVLACAIQFLRASGSLSWNINPEIWAWYGSFIGAFLLAATLIFQARAFRKQQIEAKFFEMVRYYRDNITEMRYRNPFYYKNDNEREVDEEFVTGRRVLKTIFEQYKVGIKVAEKRVFNTKVNAFLEEIFTKVKISYIEKGWGDDIDKTDWLRKFNVNEVAYLITFWGIPLDTDIELKKYLESILSNTERTNLSNEIKSIVAVYECSKDSQSVYSGNLKFTDREIFDDLKQPSVKNKKLKFFGGHQYHLGHFFRHLYQAVKYIDSQPWYLLSFKEKYNYVKTLRAQMSNYEQALLLVNSLTKMGRKWEYDSKNETALISTYNLITNLPESFIPLFEPQLFYPKVKYEWNEK
ncbi:putative phage abortive infection protein [Draconibacterium sp. IB214405]|uniref:putative phage abortive infection protein n=1 Tax=Draconibacterium sp. IB214405 TaxID=3097352 RepID=UPI002A164DA2|nr:putative phage abortive infection protein [Draconibacterium sp. IB214405]MDX8339737.1 putative phage abortive infection protein [Draconibacterium sp. IB214405]